MCYQVNSYTAKLGYCYGKMILDAFLNEFYSPFHDIRDTDTRMECALTEAQGYRTYMHSACQFGSLGPGSPGSGSSGPRTPGPLNIVSRRNWR